MTRTKAVFFWSGGKDSALCLHKVLQEDTIEVTCLLTTINRRYGRISMHGVRETLLEKQAEAIGIPLQKMYVNEGSNTEYEEILRQTLLNLKASGIDNVIFGDIFLEDLRSYREKQLAAIGMHALFPLWKQNTSNLINEFITLGFKTITCCTNDGYLGQEWTGREIDRAFVDELPTTVDPCGENGEFHTFCFDGPVFNVPARFTTGEKIYRPLEIKTTNDTNTKGFWFIDLLPV